MTSVIGQRVRRREAPRFLKGEACFVGDALVDADRQPHAGGMVLAGMGAL